MFREPSVPGASRPVVMSARDLGLSQAGTYLKKPWVGGRQKGAYSSNRKDWETVKVFQEPAFRVPVGLAQHTPGRRRYSVIPPLPWLDAAIRAGLVEMASRSGDSQEGAFFVPLEGKEMPFCSRADLLQQLKEATEATLKQWEDEKK